LKKQGKILSVSEYLGFIQLPDESRISFDFELSSGLIVGDIVEFDLQEITITKSGSSYYKAINIKLLVRPESVQMPVQIRLSKVARELNVSIGNIVDILRRHNIKIEANPNAKITNQQVAIVINSLEGLDKFDIDQKQRKQFQDKYIKGTVIDVRVSQIIKPSQIITLFPDNFTGRLSLLDLAWSIPEAQIKFKSIKVNDVLKCQILDIDFINKQVKLSLKNLEKHLSDTVTWSRLDRGDVLTCDIQEELANSYLIKTEAGIFGLISKDYSQLDRSLKFKVKIQEKLDSIDLIKFLPASLEIKEDLPTPSIQTNDFGFIEPDLKSFEAFKKSILGNHANDKDAEILQRYFSNNNNLFSKEIEAPFAWHISFEANSSVYETTFKQNAFYYFLENQTYSIENETKLLEKLSNAGYWVRISHKHGKKDVIEFSLFNENTNFYGEVITSKDKKSVKCLIRNFSFGHSFSFASDAKKRNSKNGAYFLRSPLIITNPLVNLSSDESNTKVLDFILEKSHAFEIVSKLKQDAGAILREEGRTLGLIDKFLEFQESLLDQNKGVPVFVEAFDRSTSDNGTVAITVSQSIGLNLELEDEAIINLKIKEGDGSDAELKWFADASITYYGDKCKIVFYRDVSLNNLNKGFYIELKVSKAQIQIQRSIIQDFLQKKIKIDHIESLLVQPEKIKPPVYSTVKLINEDLALTEKEQPDNNQIKAVRKAIGNNNIFLIQGPPGTGKTTVIAEIINQLVLKGERVLVTGQNHVAVDNVLAKISKIPSLNLLRVGKEDKIDKELNRYHIDHLVSEFQLTFSSFLKNQISLIKLYLKFLSENLSREEILLQYNKEVNSYLSEYGSLTEVLKQRHFILRDTISELSKVEINDTIKAFENWINSINNEIDILIQPLIYNSVDVVFATCIGIKTDPVFRESGLRFDTVIIDEAGKANIAETLVAIELGDKVILVGDQMQLPPYMDSSLIDPTDPKSFPKSEFGYGFLQEEITHALKTSFFEFLINRIKNNTFPAENLEMLNYQHRMHPNIGKFVSESFYSGKVLMGSKTHNNKLDFPSPFNKEVVFFDTSNTTNPYEQLEGTSAKNNTEAEAIADIILPLLFENNLPSNEIAIIAPYKSQVANIKKFINDSEVCQHKNIDVSTLDSFQGKEYDVILFSFTRSSNHEISIKSGKKPVKVGFLDDAKRLNVAFSRAKKKLILIGNAKTLTDRKSHYDILFNYTDLFSKLVRLSKEETIGNFVNIANYKDFKSPFEKFKDKFKVDDYVQAQFRSIGKKDGSIFGFFFKVDGYDCLLPSAFVKNDLEKYVSYTSETKVSLYIKEINNDTKRVTLQVFANKKIEVKRPNKSQIWNNNINSVKKGNKLKGKVTNKVDFGYFVSIENGIEGLLHNDRIKSTKPIQIGEIIIVNVINIDYVKQRISFSYT